MQLNFVLQYWSQCLPHLHQNNTSASKETVTNLYYCQVSQVHSAPRALVLCYDEPSLRSYPLISLQYVMQSEFLYFRISVHFMYIYLGVWKIWLDYFEFLRRKHPRYRSQAVPSPQVTLFRDSSCLCYFCC